MIYQVSDKDILKRQAAEQAPVPPPAYIKEMLQKKPKPMEPGDKRDKVMLEFAQSDAWKLLKGFITSKLAEKAGTVRESADGSRSLDEVGFKFLVADQVGRFATELTNFVEGPLRLKEAQSELTPDK